MVLLRPAAFRAPLARFARPATRASPWQQSFQRTARRGYASASDVAGEVAKKASSDLPWLAAGLVITVPSVYYILSSIETGGHHAEGHGEEHHAEGEEDESESKDEPQAKEEESKSEDSEDKAESKDSEEKEEPKDSGDEKPADDKSEDKKDDKSDKPDAQKEPVKGGISGKQEGLSNADTHHSTDTHDGSKSTKGEGVAETAKLKGTVQSDRPGAESEQKGQANQDKSK